MSKALSGKFTFVCIPADANQPIQAVQTSKAGGLTNDALLKHAKDYFAQRTGIQQQLDQLRTLSPAHRSQYIAQVQEELQQSDPAATERLKSIIAHHENIINSEERDKAVLEELLLATQSAAVATCDITALTIPTAANQYQAVSLYSVDHARDVYQMPLNQRASELLVACGHITNSQVYGDVFVGRAIDDEVGDIWERVDFTIDDADPSAEWCHIARSPGGGGGRPNSSSANARSSTAASLNHLVQQHMNPTAKGAGLQIVNGASQDPATLSYGRNGAPAMQESWGTWTQTDDEVELKIAVPAETKAKACHIDFGKNRLQVAVQGTALLQGKTFDPIDLDESTFTLQNEGSTGRELCVTLGKGQPGVTWCWVVR